MGARNLKMPCFIWFLTLAVPVMLAEKAAQQQQQQLDKSGHNQTAIGQNPDEMEEGK